MLQIRRGMITLAVLSLGVATYGNDLEDALKKLGSLNNANAPAKPPKPSRAAKPPKPAKTDPTAPAQPDGAASDQSAPAAVASLGAKPDELDLGAAADGVQSNPFNVSDDLSVCALSSRKGSRRVLSVNGVAGPVFDELMNLGSVDLHRVAEITPDGKHIAYIGVRTGQAIPVIDGKESPPMIGRPIDETSARIGRQLSLGPDNRRFYFSPTGEHLAYIRTLAESGKYAVVLDGVESTPWTEIDSNQSQFINEQLIYVASNQDQKKVVVVNNQPGEAFAGVSQLAPSANKKHYIFAAQKDQQSGDCVIYTDGKPGASIQIPENLAISNEGVPSYTKKSSQGGGHGEPGHMLCVGDQEVATSCMSVQGNSPKVGNSLFHLVEFAPVGKRFACVAKVAGGAAVFVDGKQELVYDSIGWISFSPDGTRYAYVANKGITNYAVVDGQEQDITCRGNVYFSPDSNHFAFQSADASSAKSGFVVDGKPGAAVGELKAANFAFSPDGKRYVYSGTSAYPKDLIILDGKSTEVTSLSAMPANDRSQEPPAVRFSPDSQHVYWMANNYDGSGKNSLYVDGKAVMQAGQFSFLAFSPDSKHYAFWSGSSMPLGLYVDCKEGPKYDKLVGVGPENIHFVDNNTLRCIVQQGPTLKRVTVKLP